GPPSGLAFTNLRFFALKGNRTGIRADLVASKETSTLQRKEQDIIISSIDRERHIIHMVVKGYPVTVFCSLQSDPEIYDQIKTILADAVLKAAQQNFDKSGQKV